VHERGDSKKPDGVWPCGQERFEQAFLFSGENGMPLDPEIRRLAKDPEVVAAIKFIDRYFKLYAEQKDNDPVLAEVTAENLVELCWSLLKRGVLRFKDDTDDDNTPIVQLAVNPSQRARARLIGGKLYAVRQHLRRTTK
jgi:hypothetical protein